MHVRFGGRETGNGAGETRPPRPLPTLHLSYDARAADLLFEVVSRRYEQKSIVITTNLAFQDWPTIFPNASCVTALIDRLTHHADICLIEGQSYRRREAEARRPKQTRE